MWPAKVDVYVVNLGEYIKNAGYMHESDIKTFILDPPFQRDYVYRQKDLHDRLGGLFEIGVIDGIKVFHYYVEDPSGNYRPVRAIVDGRQRTETFKNIIEGRMKITPPVLRKLGMKTKKSMKFAELPNELREKILNMQVVITEVRPSREPASKSDYEEWDNMVVREFVAMNTTQKKIPKVESYLKMAPHYGAMVLRLEKEIRNEFDVLNDWVKYSTILIMDVVHFGMNLEEYAKDGTVPCPAWLGIDDIKRSSSQLLQKIIEKREELYSKYPEFARRHTAKLRKLVRNAIKNYNMVTGYRSIREVIFNNTDSPGKGKPGTLPLALYVALADYTHSYLQNEIITKEKEFIETVKGLYNSKEVIRLSSGRFITVHDLFVSNAYNSTRLRASLSITRNKLTRLFGDPIEKRKEYNRLHRAASKYKTTKNQQIHVSPPWSVPSKERKIYILDKHAHSPALHGPNGEIILDKLIENGAAKPIR